MKRPSNKKSTVFQIARRGLVAILFAVLLVWGGVLIWHVLAIVQNIEKVKGRETGSDLQSLVPIIHDTVQHVSGLHAVMTPINLISENIAWLPGIGPYLSQIPAWSNYLTGLAETGDHILMGLDPVIQPQVDNGSKQAISERIFEGVLYAQPQIDAAVLPLTKAARARAQINLELLPNRYRSVMERAYNSFDLIASVTELLKALPTLMGEGQAVNYLIVAQNRDELRPTGGFISGLGTVQINQGKLVGFDLGDSYRIDDFSKNYPLPPEPIQRFMLAGYWVTRDANWSPDFPTSARQIQTLYKLSTGTDTNGVIAFDQSVIRSLLDITGPLTLKNFPDPVTAQNVDRFMQQAWEPNLKGDLSITWWEHRKDFMNEFGQVLINALTNEMDTQKMEAFGRLVYNLVEQKHILIYFADARAENVLSTSKMDGSLNPGNGDFIALVDTNMGFNKVDAVIDRSLNYQVDLSNLNHPTSVLTLKYLHSGMSDVPCIQQASYGNGTYEDMVNRCYWDYWRVYTAGQSILTAGDAPTVTADHFLNHIPWSGVIEILPSENGTQVYSGMMVLRPTSQQHVKLNLNLAPQCVKSVGGHKYLYALRIVKQAGLDHIEVNLNVRLPAGASFSWSDGWKADNSGVLTWQGNIIKDQDFSIYFELP